MIESEGGVIGRTALEAIPKRGKTMKKPEEWAKIVHEERAAHPAKRGGRKDEHGKTRKPAGWTPPDVAGELRKQGWEG